MLTIANEVAVHALAVITLTTLAVVFRGPIKSAATTMITIARGLCRNVAGEWRATLRVDGEIFEQTVRLRQFADFIWGAIQCSTTGRTFRVTGRVVHHTLIARYELTDGHAITIDNGVFSLRLNDDGDQLKGHLTCSVGRASRTSQCEYIWRRTTQIAPAAAATEDAAGKLTARAHTQSESTELAGVR